MQTYPHRTVIYCKDVMILTGRKERTARKLLSTIRKVYGKEDWEFVSLEEFSNYTGIPKEEVIPFLL